ncbi:MAG: hypothetical protein AMXMBFR36_04380 [Acidobacteriota bacterium]
MRGAATALTLVGILLGTNAGAQNLLVNPDFDENPDGWTVVAGQAPVWQADDEGGCPASGSAVVASAVAGGNFETALLSQCFPADGATTVAASISFREGSSSFNQVGVGFHLSSDCTDSLPPFGASPTTPASPGVWTRLEMPATAVPVGTQSLEFRVGGSNLGPQPFTIELDRAWFAFEDRIFAADFETDDGIGDPCRWSASVP